jgi:hypothetical protein
MFNREDKVDLEQPKEATVHGCDSGSIGKISKDQYTLEYPDQVAREVC